MMPAEYNFVRGNFDEGDDNRFFFILTDPITSAYYDWAGVTKAWITLKKNETDDDADKVIQLNSVDHPTQVKINHPTADEGNIWFWFKAADCKVWAALGELHYDVQVLKDGLINTLVKGTIPFGHEITEAIA